MVTRQAPVFGGDRKESVNLALSFERKGRELQEITKAVVGILVLQTRSLLGDGIPPRLPLRVSLAKPPDQKPSGPDESELPANSSSRADTDS